MLSAQDAEELSQAAAFVGHVETPEGSRVPAILSVPEIERLIHLYVQEDEADAVLREVFGGKSAGELTVPELLEARVRLERLLAASLGGAAARYIIEDRFTISTGEARAARRVVPGDAAVPAHQRAPARVGGGERGGLHLHDGRRRAARQR